MKVVIICGAGYVSGKERMALFLLKKLKEHDINVCCITSIWGDGDFNKMLDAEQIAYVQMPIGFISKVFGVKPILMTLHQLLFLPKLWIKYNRFIKAFNPVGIVHTNLHHSILLLPFITLKRKNLYYLHETVSESNFYKRIYALFETRFTKFVGVSDFVSNTLVNCNIPVNKITTIHNSIEVQKVENLKVQKSNYVRIGIVGQVAEWKGHEDLLEAMSILKKKGVKNIQCLIIGKGSDFFIEHLHEIVKELNIVDEVIFEGFKTFLDDIYEGLDIVCVPSRFKEPFGLSALEPANYSIPVIATNTGGLPEIIINNYSGLLVSPNNPIQLAENLERLIISGSLRCQLGENAKIRLEQNFSSETFTTKWINQIL